MHINLWSSVNSSVKIKGIKQLSSFIAKEIIN
jgi:hypothetical protein